MDLLTIDVLGYLINFIKKDLDKCYFLMTCKRVSQCEFYFNEQKILIKLQIYYGLIILQI